MANVLKADGSAADAYVRQFFAGSLPSHFFVQFDLYIPTATFTALVGASASFGAANFESAIDGFFTKSSFLPTASYSTDDGSTPGSGFTPGAWHTVVFEYNSAARTWKLDGATFDSYTLSDTLSNRTLYFGANGPANASGEIYYLRDIRVGTTAGGVDLFADDFSGGTFGAWTGTSGAVSIVDDSTIPAEPAGDDTTTFSGPVRVGVAFNDTALEPSPTWTYLTDGSSRVASYEIQRGRQFEFDKTDAGTATVSVNDRDGTLDPTNSAGPYYGLIEPLLQIRIELWNPVTLQYFTRFRGWIETFDYNVEPFTHQDQAGNTVGVTRLRIECVDIFEILTAIEMQPDGSFGDDPSTATPATIGNIFFDNASARSRIEQVLGNAAIDPGFYVVFTLNVDVQESVYSPSENVLQVVQDAADAEFPTVSNVYTDRLGRLAVHGRLAKFDPDGVAAGAGATSWPFHRWKAGDGKAVAASPTDTAHIRTLAYDRGLSKVFNSALCTPNGIDDLDKTTVTGSAMAGQYYADAPSIAQFGYRSWSAENLLIGALTGDPLTTAGAGTLTGNTALAECLAFATYIVENYKTPRNRISDMTFKSILPTNEGAEANWNLLCQADISDVIEVTVRGPGDSPSGYIFNSEEFFIEGVHETATPATGEYAMVELRVDTSPKAYFPIGGGGGVGVT